MPTSDGEWAFRSHEEDVRAILRVGLLSQDGGRRDRAEALINRFRRLGMFGLGTLLTEIVAPLPPAEG